VHVVRQEYALSVADILYRRTRIGLETRDGVEEAARRVATTIAPELGWDDGEVKRQINRAMDARTVNDLALEEAE